jgi:hypothetical protein
VTGVRVTRDECHVDDEPPATFAVILDEFVATERLDVATVPILGRGDGEVERHLADPALTARWCAFHQDRWRPRITSARANLTQPRMLRPVGVR